jgi:hypothetical protein
LRSDSQFVDPSSDDYHLLSASPLIDQGDHAPLFSDYDIDGDEHIFDGDDDSSPVVDNLLFPTAMTHPLFC